MLASYAVFTLLSSTENAANASLAYIFIDGGGNNEEADDPFATPD